FSRRPAQTGAVGIDPTVCFEEQAPQGSPRAAHGNGRPPGSSACPPRSEFRDRLEVEGTAMSHRRHVLSLPWHLGAGPAHADGEAYASGLAGSGVDGASATAGTTWRKA